MAETHLEAAEGPRGWKKGVWVLSLVSWEPQEALWQEVLCGGLVFFFHFLSGFSREKCKHIPCRETEAPVSRKDRESLGPWQLGLMVTTVF